MRTRHCLYHFLSDLTLGNVQIGSNVQETVAALLETTKRLQDCLGKWSMGKASDEQVSDVYVDVGTKFNATVTAFMGFGIDLS